MSRPSGSSNGSSATDNLTPLLKTMGGDDCDRPACDDTKSALSAAMKRVDRRRTKTQVVEDGDALSSGYRRECPPTRDQIGAQTWSLLHSMVRVCMNNISIYSYSAEVGSQTPFSFFVVLPNSKYNRQLGIQTNQL